MTHSTLRPFITAASLILASLPTVGFDSLELTNVTEPSGLELYKFKMATSQFKPHPPGTAFVDVDGDRYPDLYLIQGEGRPNRLMRNAGDGTFVDITDGSGADSLAFTVSIAVGDYDNDGLQDLYLGNEGANQLLRNNGDGTFTDVTETAGVSTGIGTRSYGTGWLDCDRDGWLDLYVGQWDGIDDRDKLLRNNGDGTFTDITAGSGVFNDGLVLALAIADFDNDGHADVYAANDVGDDHLFRGLGDCFFEDVTLAAGVGTDAGNAMGAAVGDYDNNGFVDIYLSDTLLNDFDTFDGLPLYRNEGDFTFTNVSAEEGVLGVFSWGTVFGDFNSDGWLDIYLAAHALEIPYSDRIYLNRGPGETFLDVGQFDGGNLGNARGVAIADLERDGDLDIFVVNAMVNTDPVAGTLEPRQSALWRNDSPGGAWLMFELVGTTSARDAIGARVEVKDSLGKQRMRQIHGAMSYGSSSAKTLHFGLGAATSTDSIVVHWPSGLVQEFRNDVPAGQHLTQIEAAPMMVIDRPWAERLQRVPETLDLRLSPSGPHGSGEVTVSVWRGREPIASTPPLPWIWAGRDQPQRLTVPTSTLTPFGPGEYRLVAELRSDGELLARAERPFEAVSP